jgi:DNA-directed RNA polymerase specialized sigma24 family protein
MAGGVRAVDELVGTPYSVDVALIVAEQLRQLMGLLPDEQLRLIAVAKMEGRTNKEIAGEMDCALRTVERRLGYIRAIWREEVTDID